MSRRSRSANFTPNETIIFMKLIDKYKLIFDKKSVDSETNRKKAWAWKQVAKSFNRLSPRSIALDVKQLRQKFKNIKRQRKLELHAGTWVDPIPHEVKIENEDESPDNSMDSLDFKDSQSADSTYATRKMNLTPKLTAGPVRNLRRKCGRPGTSNDTNQNDAVREKCFFFFNLFSRRN